LNTGEYRQFLGVARGSAFELQTQLTIAKELEFGNASQRDAADALSHEIGKMIFGIIEAISCDHPH
jgi:four helix bundle protein